MGTFDELNDLMAQEMARLGILPPSPDGEARQARWRCGDGWLVGYTTERIKGGPFDGRFATLAYKPTGKGARTGKATSWERVYFRGFSTRKAARNRAIRLYEQHRAR